MELCVLIHKEISPADKVLNNQVPARAVIVSQPIQVMLVL